MLRRSRSRIKEGVVRILRPVVHVLVVAPAWVLRRELANSMLQREEELRAEFEVLCNRGGIRDPVCGFTPSDAPASRRLRDSEGYHKFQGIASDSYNTAKYSV